MKKLILLNRVAFIMLALGGIIFLDGCKKVDSKNEPITISQDAKQKAQEMINNNPQLQNVTYNLNKKGTTFFADKYGNKIEPSNHNNYTYQCDDIEYAPTSILESVVREWSCSLGYRFKVKWKISASLPILSNNPIYQIPTKGKFKIKSTDGSTIYSENAITAVDITILGDDPSTGNINRFYSLEYYTQWIPFSYFTLDTAPLEHQIFAQTDCIFAPQIFNSNTSPALGSVLDPCNRIDQIAITNAEVFGGVYSVNGTLFGYYQNVLPCTPPSGSTMPDRHEVKIRCVEPLYYEATFRNISPQFGTWPGTPLTEYGYLNPFNILTQTGTIGTGDVYYIRDLDITVSGIIRHGAYKVIYRNVKTGNCFGPWSQEYDATF